MCLPGHGPQVVLLPGRLPGRVEAVGGGRVGDVPVAAPAADGVGLEEAAVVVVERVEEDLGLILEVVGEAPVRPAKDTDFIFRFLKITLQQISDIETTWRTGHIP